jgi:hypothetical protein
MHAIAFTGLADERLLSWERAVLRGVAARLGRLDLDHPELTHYEREVIGIIDRRLSAADEAERLIA